MSYNWPATPSRLAYLKDLETADATRRNLRELISFLSKNTNARRIHLIGYSAGSRLAFETAYQIALQNRASGRKTVKLGQVILIGSDLDRTYFTQSLQDGLLDGMDHLTLYMSASDAALQMSRLLFGRNRLGQIAEDEDVNTNLSAQLRSEQRLSLIDASDASGADLGNGHWYFRSSPWVSSDIFVSLLLNRKPAARGLLRPQQNPIWAFPKDYPSRISAALKDG
ncbi:MAG: alpha/beta hydrolase [Paracoccaceae bacterium]